MIMNENRIYVLLGEKVFEKRRQLGLNQKDLADRVGLTRTSITNIEKGIQRIQLHTVYQIAHALGISTNELLPDLRAGDTDVNSLVNEQKTLDKTGEVRLKEDEKDIVLKVIRTETSRKEKHHGKKK